MISAIGENYAVATEISRDGGVPVFKKFGDHQAVDQPRDAAN